jgi:integrase
MTARSYRDGSASRSKRQIRRASSRLIVRSSAAAARTSVRFPVLRARRKRALLFDAGKNVKQVAEWLGLADPAFTLRVYVHLLDDGLGGADFFDEVLTQPAVDWSSSAA